MGAACLWESGEERNRKPHRLRQEKKERPTSRRSRANLWGPISCYAGKHDVARARARKSAITASLLPGLDGSHRRHVVTKWSVRCPGRILSSRLFDFRAHNDPVPIFRIADAFCVAGFDEPVNDGR